MSIASRCIAAALLFWALARHRYDYYVLLRFVTCGAAAHSSYLAFEQRRRTWPWLLAALALLFNPVFPVHLGRDVWKVVDVLVALFLLASIYFVRERPVPGNSVGPPSS